MMFQSSLRLRLILAFILTSLIVFSLAAIVSYHETNKKVDEFFDTYQMALARQLASADWNAIPMIRAEDHRLIRIVVLMESGDIKIGNMIFRQQLSKFCGFRSRKRTDKNLGIGQILHLPQHFKSSCAAPIRKRSGKIRHSCRRLHVPRAGR